MSQVVSKTRDNHETNILANKYVWPAWKRPCMIIFHGLAASTYGYAICWQNVSAASLQLYTRTHPAMRIYGKFRFLTFQNLIIQFVAYLLFTASDFRPKSHVWSKMKEFWFTTLAVPVGMLVVSSFWSIWFVAGRENIFPASLEPFYPSWLNHITHTIIAPINLTELLLVRHQYSSDKKSISTLVAYISSYTSFLLYIRFTTGRFVYPFLNKMEPVPVGAFMVGMGVFCVIFYKSGKLLNDFVHGVKSIKDKIQGTKGKHNK